MFTRTSRHTYHPQSTNAIGFTLVTWRRTDTSLSISSHHRRPPHPNFPLHALVRPPAPPCGFPAQLRHSVGDASHVVFLSCISPSPFYYYYVIIIIYWLYELNCRFVFFIFITDDIFLQLKDFFGLSSTREAKKKKKSQDASVLRCAMFLKMLLSFVFFVFFLNALHLVGF